MRPLSCSLHPAPRETRINLSTIELARPFNGRGSETQGLELADSVDAETSLDPPAIGFAVCPPRRCQTSRTSGAVKVGRKREDNIFPMPNQVIDGAGSHEAPPRQATDTGPLLRGEGLARLIAAIWGSATLPVSEPRVVVSSLVWNESMPS